MQSFHSENAFNVSRQHHVAWRNLKKNNNQPSFWSCIWISCCHRFGKGFQCFQIAFPPRQNARPMVQILHIKEPFFKFLHCSGVDGAYTGQKNDINSASMFDPIVTLFFLDSSSSTYFVIQSIDGRRETKRHHCLHCHWSAASGHHVVKASW